MTAKKVLIVVENLPVPFDRRVWMEATTLARAGYEVSVICPVGPGAEELYEVLEDIHIYRHPMPPDGNSVGGYLREYMTALRWELALARRVQRERGFDVIHICNPPDLMFLVAAWFKLFGCAVVFDQHDLNPELYEDKYGRRDLFYRALCLCEGLTYKLADAVIATNESYKEIALERGKKRYQDLFVVRSGPDLSRFKLLPPNPLHRRGRKHLVGYLGIIGPQDGVDYLLRAADHLVRELGRDDVHFMIMGDGPALPGLKALAADLRLDDHVEFTGRVQGQDLLSRLSSCDVCVGPDPKTPYNDRCTMNKLLEYMALAKPIVQFDLLEGRRSVGEAALYATPNDEADMAAKIVELLDAPELRQSLGAAGRKRMEQQFSWSHQAPRLLEAYAEVFSRRVRPAQPVPRQA